MLQEAITIYFENHTKSIDTVSGIQAFGILKQVIHNGTAEL
jgi:hypothetical protein